MSSPAQIAANIANAKSSTGPRTEAGRARSSKNSVVFGLFSGDFIRPGEEQAYTALRTALIHELAPIGVLEEVLTEEIQRATWRLRRCGEVESHLALRLNDGVNYILDPMEAANPNTEKIQRSVDRARSQAHRLLHKCTSELRKLQTERQTSDQIDEEQSTDQPNEQPAPGPDWVPCATDSGHPASTPRNAPCPCGSGQKHKRCCGKNAPAVLGATRKAA